jgi:GxxExxY protein
MQTRIEPPERVDLFAHDVIGAAIEVHRILGRGFLESIYEMALVQELRARGIHFERQVTIPIHYKGTLIGEHRLDLLVAGELVVELKASQGIVDAHVAQTLSYLKAGAFQLGLILNFNARTMKDGVRRVVSSG